MTGAALSCARQANRRNQHGEGRGHSRTLTLKKPHVFNSRYYSRSGSRDQAQVVQKILCKGKYSEVRPVGSRDGQGLILGMGKKAGAGIGRIKVGSRLGLLSHTGRI